MQILRKDVLGYYFDGKYLICCKCYAEKKEMIEIDLFLMKEDMDKNYIYRCDRCEKIIE